MYAQGWYFLFFKEEKKKVQKENVTFFKSLSRFTIQHLMVSPKGLF